MAEREGTGTAGASVADLLSAAERERGAERLTEAETLSRRALARQPDSAEAAALLGLVLAERKQLKEAVPYFRRALTLDPKRAPVHYNLGIALKDLGDRAAAVESLRRALALDPKHVAALNDLGNALRDMGRPAAAIDCYRRALALKPGYSKAHNNLGNALRDIGDAEAAAASFRRALDLRPGDPDAIYNLSTAKRFDPDSPEIAEAEAALGAKGLSAKDRCHLHFALGKMYDDCGAADKAFAHYREANRLKRPRVDRAARVALTSRLIAGVSKGLLRRLRPVGHSSERPVFIIGMPRSGTTLVEQIVASHPRAFGAGELEDIPKLVKELGKALKTDAPYPENLRRITAPVARELAMRYLKRLRGLSPKAERVAEKGIGNYRHLGLVAALFPKARIIHIKRDPLDTCLSCYFQNFTGRQDYTYDLADLGLYYREYERLMAHWRRVLLRPMLEVQYEELVANQEKVSRQIIAFLGLDWDDRCLDFHRTERAVQTASANQVRQPIYTASVGRWRAYEAHLGPLKRALGLDGGDSAPSQGAAERPAAGPDLLRRIERMREAGRVGEAEAAARAALAAAPDDAEIHHQLGRVLLDQGRNAEAEASLRRALGLAPRLASAHADLGRALWLANRHDEAAAACRRAIAIDPRHRIAHNMLGHVLRTLGDFAEAEAVLRRATAIAPGTADPHSNLGLLYADRGRRDEAVACFEQALAAEPESAAAHYYLSLHKPVAPGDPRVAAMLDLLATRRFTPEARCFLLFALGRAFDRLGEYDRAFGYLAEANQARRKMFDFDIAAEIQAIERTIAAFPAARLGEASGCADEMPIFVAGLPRSGKSLIEGLLTRHPRVRGAGESYAMIRIALQLPKRLGSDRPFPECLPALDPSRARALGAEYVAELRRRHPDAERTVDTRPSNLRLVGLIRLLLPRARVIVCRRDPRDLGLQCYFQNYSGLAYSFDLAELAKFTLANDRLMAHWRAALPDWVLEVRYEDLVRDPAAQSRRIFAFCGLDWDAAFPGLGAAFPVKLHDGEIGHWRRYARQLAPLIAAGGAEATAAARDG